MSHLQEKILKDYRSVFPDDSLTKISDKTQIQITRVFRIFNGAEMKLKEFESFQNVLSANASSDLDKALAIFTESYQKLSRPKIQRVICDLESFLKMENYKSSITLNHHTNSASI